MVKGALDGSFNVAIILLLSGLCVVQAGVFLPSAGQKVLNAAFCCVKKHRLLTVMYPSDSPISLLASTRTHLISD